MYRRIEQLLQSAGISAYRLCKDTGIPQTTFTHWKQGRNKPNATQLKKIADYFGVTLGWLMGDDTTLEPVAPSDSERRVPILGRIPGGVPVREITDVEGYIYYAPPRPTQAEFVALRVVGHSMEPTIPDGCVVVIRVTESCDPGDICAVSINGEDATCKLVKPDPEGGVYLMPINPQYDPIHYTAHDIASLPVRIIGTVEEVRYSPKRRQ